jgi:hypothetical protein
MDTKHELTKKFLEMADIEPIDEKTIGKHYALWWKNLRKNGDRSFRLTTEGYMFLCIGGYLKFYQIDLPDDLTYSNQLVIWLDKYIDCPYYLDKYSIYVSREKVAIQLILFGGDLEKFGRAKFTSQNSH